MMDSIKQRIVSYVKANQPVSVADMIRDLSIGRSSYYEEAKALRRLGMLRSVSGIGVFASEADHQTWLEHGGREAISRRAVEANAAGQQAKGIAKALADKDEPKMFMPYNPDKNGVVAEFMKSEAHQRLMMVYGRVGA